MITISPRFKVGTTAHLFLLKNNKILLQRRCNTGFMDGYYSVIAGHINGGETIREAMIREALEEAGLEIEIDELKIIHVMHRKHKVEKIDFFLSTKKWVGKPIIGEPEKADDLRWFDLEKLPTNTVPYIKYALEQIAIGEIYSEFGW